MASSDKTLSNKQRLEKLKDYCKKIARASSWHNSKESISAAQTGKSVDSIREYIYEFYCYLRIVSDLQKNYEIEFVEGQKYGSNFPKKPGSKKNFPYFSIKERATGKEKFQICAGVNIKGPDITSAPDISILNGETGDDPTYQNIEQLSDAKFRHKKGAKVSKGEFNDIFSMVFNLECDKIIQHRLEYDFFKDKLDLNGNNILTNGLAYNENVKHHCKLPQKLDSLKM